MKTEKRKGLNNKSIIIYTPESSEDVEKLKQMESQGQASSNASFGDWKNKSKKKLKLSDFGKD